MAFDGVAIVTQITDRKVHIGGTLHIQLGNREGTIGLFGDATADVQLPEGFIPREVSFGGQALDLAALIEVSYVVTTDVDSAVPVSITKGGVPFQITFHNDTSSEGGFPTGELEIYVSYVGQL